MNWSWRSNVTITVRRSGVIVAQTQLHNLIVTSGLGLARDAILGNESFLIEQVGLGANPDAPVVGDTALGDERVRADILAREQVGSDTALTTAYVAPAIANDFVIKEIGWFGGSLATEVIDTGVLISRVLYDHTKTSLESIQIDRQDTFAEAP